MRKQMRKSTLLGSLAILLLLGVDSSMASTDIVNEDNVQAVFRLPMAVWYGLSVALAFIGYMSAKSKH